MRSRARFLSGPVAGVGRVSRDLPENTYDLYVNLVDTSYTREFEQRIRVAFPAAKIYVSKNIGRDLGGHFQLMRNIPMEDYRFFCLIHSKMSPHLAAGESLLWRRRLLTPLMGESGDCGPQPEVDVGRTKP